MKILVTGGDGEFCKHLVEQGKEHLFLTPTKEEADISHYWQLDRYFYTHQFEFDIVIHAAAITRPMVIHEDNPSLSIQTNIVGTSNVEETGARLNLKIIYFSSNYVYEGTKGNYKESDPVKPFNNYGLSKLGGECAVSMYKNSLILRITMTEKPFLHKKAYSNLKSNFMFHEDLVKILPKLINMKGIINVGGKSQSVYDFVKEEKPDIEPIYLSEISDVNMATDCSMNTNKMMRVIDDSTV